jgi:hypothetical protein
MKGTGNALMDLPYQAMAIKGACNIGVALDVLPCPSPQDTNSMQTATKVSDAVDPNTVSYLRTLLAEPYVSPTSWQLLVGFSPMTESPFSGVSSNHP